MHQSIDEIKDLYGKTPGQPQEQSASSTPDPQQILNDHLQIQKAWVEVSKKKREMKAVLKAYEAAKAKYSYLQLP